MIDYVCPHCKSELEIDDEYAGQKGKCNKCGGSISVPARENAYAHKEEITRLGSKFWAVVLFLPFIAIVWALRLPKSHGQKRIAIAVPSLWLVFALFSMSIGRTEISREYPKNAVSQKSFQRRMVVPEKEEEKVQPEIAVSKRKEEENAQSALVCNEFNVVASMEGGFVSAHLETDLPDYAEIFVSVSRTYYERGDEETAYSLDYFSEKSTVGAWRRSRSISVDDGLFSTRIQERMDKMGSLGIPFEVAKIEEKIEVYFVLPVNQRNPLFGKGNANLQGLMVPETGLRSINGTRILHKSLAVAGSVTTVSRKANYLTLKLGYAYRLSKSTPLMPEFEPSDPNSALALVRKLPVSSIIVVKSKRTKRNNPWYYVEAYDSNRISLGIGWINSIALMGQDISIVQ